MEKRIQAVAALWNEGRGAKQIMEDLSLSKNQTYRTIKAAREKGLIAPKPPAQYPLRGVPMGSLGRSLEKQGEDLKVWLLRSVPEGSSMADFAVACLLDIYEEEKENG